MTAEKIEQEDHGKSQAAAQLASIWEMVEALRKAREADNSDAIEEAEQAIHDDPLSIEVRSGWHAVDDDSEAEEYRVLLCWGGPAVQITGDLNEHNEPSSFQLQYQDWGTPWTRFNTSLQDEKAIREYLSCFYFGE